MKIKSFTLAFTLLFQFVSVTVFSQKKANLNSLLNTHSEFIFPQTPDKISKALQVKTVFYEDANDEKYAKWLTPSGLELYCSLGKNNAVNEMFFDIPEDQSVIVGGLPFGLTMNQSTLQDANTQFAKYGAKIGKLGDDSEFSGGSKMTFKKGSHYATLLFDKKNILKFLGLSTELVDPAAN
ncbi:hypothetical protein [Chryseobacterium pennipullorum]|uniref:Uncharacterized protein n=1 Tax=Chryseobacterium pennipullorum TaxID=2258963 RepID=A0A3D9AVV2_9FLAO|nr:hypothetical protein [Chryseobacterium pennipullorum]REC45484.1 hypothetical protein DRF67_16255 [Chryseobacterium pennipullorum]